MSRRDRRTAALASLLIVVALIMLTAPVYALLGEKGIGVSPALWNIAVALCRAVTGLFGLLAVVSTVTGHGSGSSREDTYGSIAAGVVLIVAAIAGLGLVIVITGLGGLGVLYGGGHTAVAAVRSRRPEPPPPRRGEEVEPVGHPPAASISYGSRGCR